MGLFQADKDCYAGLVNFGYAAGCSKIKHAKRLLFVPRGTAITIAQAAALKDTILAATINDTKSSRWLMTPQIVGIEDTSEGMVSESVPLAGNIPVRQGFISFNYRFIEGGYAAHQARASLNEIADLYDVFIIDAGNQLLGWQEIDNTTNLPVIRAFTLNAAFAYVVMPDGSNVEQYMQTVGLANPDQLQHNMVGIPLGFDPSIVTGLKHANLVYKAEPSANVFKVSAYTGNGTVDLSAQFSSAMANASYWKATNKETGAVCTITSVAANGDGWNLTMDDSDTDYPDVGDYFVVEWVAPSSLPTGLTSKYESNKLSIKVTQ